jgi:hypothetical protein
MAAKQTLYFNRRFKKWETDQLSGQLRGVILLWKRNDRTNYGYDKSTFVQKNRPVP